MCCCAWVNYEVDVTHFAKFDIELKKFIIRKLFSSRLQIGDESPHAKNTTK